MAAVADLEFLAASRRRARDLLRSEPWWVSVCDSADEFEVDQSWYQPHGEYEAHFTRGTRSQFYFERSRSRANASAFVYVAHLLPWTMNGSGVCFGGAVATLLETAAANAAQCATRRSCATSELRVEFHQPVQSPGSVRIDVKVGILEEMKFGQSDPRVRVDARLCLGGDPKAVLASAIVVCGVRPGEKAQAPWVRAVANAATGVAATATPWEATSPSRAMAMLPAGLVRRLSDESASVHAEALDGAVWWSKLIANEEWGVPGKCMTVPSRRADFAFHFALGVFSPFAFHRVCSADKSRHRWLVTFTRHSCNGMGNSTGSGAAHGGAVASVLDLCTANTGSIFGGGRGSPTVSIDVKYVQSLPVPGSYLVSTEILETIDMGPRRRARYRITGVLRGPDGVVFAEAETICLGPSIGAML